VLVELSVMEQRYQAVMAVLQDGWKVSEVADRLGVARQSVQLDSPPRTRRYAGTCRPIAQAKELFTPDHPRARSADM
jgi:transposase-like protein